jgi:hypothetical protein
VNRILPWLCLVVAVAACPFLARPARAADTRTWRLVSNTAPFPPTLSIPMGVYDPVRGRVLMVDMAGSADGVPVTVHVFIPSPEPCWSTLEVTGDTPLGRYLGNIVYDPPRDRLLLIGDCGWGEMETWSLALSGTPTWERLATTGEPPELRGRSAIYDPGHDCVVLYGGCSAGYAYTSELWTLSLATRAWSRVAPGGAAPPGREGHGALYDPERQRMIVFGGHYEDSTRHFLNDVWALSLGDSCAWSEILPAGAPPGARSAFGTVYDPVRRRMLVHGGINAQSGIEPDELWALTLDGTPTWTQIVTENTLRGRSYPVDAYDPAGDRFLACGGGGYARTSALSLADPVRWETATPPDPLVSPGSRIENAVVHDTRRDRFVVMGGNYSSVDSAMWSFDPRGTNHWRPVNGPVVPGYWSTQIDIRMWPSVAYDSLGDRFLLFGGGEVWSSPRETPGDWTLLRAYDPVTYWELGQGAGVAVDARRNRLIVSGGWMPYPHGAGYTLYGVWALSLDGEPTWSRLGDLAQDSGSHAAYYDALNDRLVILGGYSVADIGRWRSYHGPAEWTTPLDSTLVWTLRSSTSGEIPLAPPKAYSAYDPKSNRLYIASDSTIWTRLVDDTGPWTKLDLAGTRPVVTSAIAYDPVEDQLLALFAAPPGTSDVQAWALAVGPLSLSWVTSARTAGAVELRCRSVAAYGRDAVLERREESTDWTEVGPLVFDAEGLARFTDHDVAAGHDYRYRVSVAADAGPWRSDEVFVPDAASLQLALLGARPQPAVGIVQVTLSLPAGGSAELEVFDIHGRRCLVREVGGLGPGIHSLRLPESAAWRPGVYYARLRRAGESRTSRVVLMR